MSNIGSLASTLPGTLSSPGHSVVCRKTPCGWWIGSAEEHSGDRGELDPNRACRLNSLASVFHERPQAILLVWHKRWAAPTRPDMVRDLRGSSSVRSKKERHSDWSH
jgi:hypothetical protein